VTVALASASGVWAASAAGAAIQNVTLSPTSGPPGTSVHISGTGCSPGVLLSSAQDFVEVSSPTLLPVDTRFAVAANGSWGGVFTVPANAPAVPATVTAVCMSDGLPSLQTIYGPAVFVVSAGSTSTTVTVTVPQSGTTIPTNGTTPTTRPHPESTSPGPVPPGVTPTTAGPGGPGSGTDPVAPPGHDVGNGPSGSAGPTLGPSTTSPGSTAVKGTHGDGDVASAADLRAPSLAAPATKGSGGVGWLLWLLVLVVLGLLAFWGWVYRTRRHSPEPDPVTESQ